MYLRINPIAALLLFFFSATISTATNWYSVAGGGWNRTSHSGADECAAQTCPNEFGYTNAVGDTIFVDRNVCSSAGVASPCPGWTDAVGCHSIYTSTTINGSIIVKANAYLQFASMTLSTTSYMEIKSGATVFTRGAISNVAGANRTYIRIKGGGTLATEGSGTVYMAIAGGGQLICCGAYSVFNNGVNFFGSIFGSTSAPACPGTILPVDLLYFTGVYDKNVRLSWATASEKNNDYFKIERSTDFETWESIGEIKSQMNNGNSTDILNYTFDDNDVSLGMTYYYRLTQVDFDGRSETFKIINVHAERFDEEGPAVSPNPSSDGKFSISTINIPDDVTFEYTLLNSSGHQLMHNKIDMNTFYGDIHIDASQYGKGFYFLVMKSSDGKIHHQKITLQ